MQKSLEYQLIKPLTIFRRISWTVTKKVLSGKQAVPPLLTLSSLLVRGNV